MSCVTLTKGRTIPCKGGAGGIKAVSFVPWSSGLITSTNGEIATLPAGTIYKYQVKNTGNTLNEEFTSDMESRNIVYSGTLSVVLQKADLATRNEIKMLAMGELIVFVEDYNGEIYVVGIDNGANVTAGTILETGGAKADFYGSRLTINWEESDAYSRLSTSAKATYASNAITGVED